MNLVLDFGNTRIKAAVFEGDEMILQEHFASNSVLLTSELLNQDYQKVLIASVTDQHTEVFDFLSPRFSTHLFTATTKLPFRNRYQSALTLGSDRIAASVGAFHFYPNKNVLTIDAGTCIKYNFVNESNEYLGGAISPGIPMRLRAMHDYTAKLPAISVDKSYTKLIGQSTQESLLTGALIAAACEVDGMISRYLELYPDLIVLVTGGDSDYLCSQLKSRFFANQNLLLYGLNTILQQHLEN